MTDAEAAAEKAKHEDEQVKARESRQKGVAAPPAKKEGDASPKQAPDATAPKDSGPPKAQ